ncbi:MAG: hypothetical protein JEY94_18200 [Melioribacteraceae bacterium]|nr:hypothetical protein [Melioribacteraceae bacterium]
MDDRSKITIKKFKRDFFESENQIAGIGTGSIGGKASGLANIENFLAASFNHNEFPSVKINIPSLVVIRTDVFDKFIEQNKLEKIAFSDERDSKIANAFQKAELPFEILGDLRTIANNVKTPLAVRSSSKLEDALFEPFAGIYSTKMLPNNQTSADERFVKLCEAIKLVYASAFFKNAKEYFKATKNNIADEKMAVIIQEVVGGKFSDKYYPHLSGVARSYNYYSFGRAKPEDGIVNLALGLGKTIVDGGISWSYSPAYPKLSPPYSSISDLMKNTQNKFWAINMGKPPAYDPINEAEFMFEKDLADAEKDKTLKYLASTYNVSSDRVNMGIGISGPRILNFMMLLHFEDIPVNRIVKNMLKFCEDKLNTPVEIEFAMTFDPLRFGLLQVRPMVVSDEKVDINESGIEEGNILLGSENVLGNGVYSDIKNIVYVKPESFESKFTKEIAVEVESINKDLINKKEPYLVIGFGRWGSSDPWLGIPVNWSNISGASVIVEVATENMNVDLSQGSHFFHNLNSFKVSYFSLSAINKYKIDWKWLENQAIISDQKFVRHIHLENPLNILVDGRKRLGIVEKSRE